MKKRNITAIVALMIAAVLAVALVVACGDKKDEKSTASPTAGGGINGQLTGTPMENFTQILGREPTGLAKEIADKGVIVVANDLNYPPQSYVDETTKDIVGFDVDSADTMAKILGIRVKFVHPAWETIPTGLKTGQYDVSIGSMTITPERQKTLSFTEPYYYTPAQVFVKKGGMQITGPDDLAGKTVGVGAQTTYYDYLKANTSAKVKTYTTDADAFPDLLNGNIEFVMTAAPTGLEAMNKGKPMEFSGKPFYYEDLGFAVKLGETDLVAVLNYAIQKMHEIPEGGEALLTQSSKTWYNGVDLTVKQ